MNKNTLVRYPLETNNPHKNAINCKRKEKVKAV